jgi:hypothetical protein
MGQEYGGSDAWPFLEEGSYKVVQDLLFDRQQEEEKALLRLEHQPQEEQQQPRVGQKPAQVILASHSFSCLCLFRISWLLTYCSVVPCVANTPSVFRCLFCACFFFDNISLVNSTVVTSNFALLACIVECLLKLFLFC